MKQTFRDARFLTVFFSLASDCAAVRLLDVAVETFFMDGIERIRAAVERKIPSVDISGD